MARRAALLALSVLVTGGAASAGETPLLRARYRVDGVDDRARVTTGELFVDLEDLRARHVVTVLGRRTVRRHGTARPRPGELVVELDGARATYRPDGRGGLAGRFEGPEGPFDELLAPLADEATVAAMDSARGPRDVLELARAARRDSLESLRALVDELHARDRLYPTLAALGAEERRALSLLARDVAPPLPPTGEDELEDVKGSFRHDAIVVLGFTAPFAERVHAPSDVQDRRCKIAALDFRAGRAPYVIVSGGRAHPSGTPIVEALEMKAELVRQGVPARRIVLEPAARHTTTNLRNVGRIMLRKGWKRALLVTSVGHAFYVGVPGLSSFGSRCRRELGYVPGRLDLVDANHASFVPRERCKDVDRDDPFDP